MASGAAATSLQMLTRSVMLPCTVHDSDSESTAPSSDAQASQQGDHDSASQSITTTLADTYPASAGSVLHDAGECKPCAFFGKPQGCTNGRECLHCHACPPGEIKSRRKLRSARLREAVEASQSPKEGGLALESPPVLTPFTLRPSLLAEDCSGPTPSIDSEERLMTSRKAHCARPAAEDVVPSESKGSNLHSTGECKPCAWFWHPKGCQNGADCEYCHLCLKGELKARRKQKADFMRLSGTDDGCESNKDSVNCNLCPGREKRIGRKQVTQHDKLGNGKEMKAVTRQLAKQNQLILMQQQQLSQLQMQLQFQQQMMMYSITRLGNALS